jgi:exosortase A
MADSAGALGRISVRSSLWAAGLYCLALLFIYRETAWSMVHIWSRSDTFAHGFLIVPISLWLIWNRRDLLGSVKPEPAWWVSSLVIPLGVVWMFAWLVDVAVIQQLAFVAMLVAGAWAIMGDQLARLLCFPMFFLFFAVPMGEALIAPMREFTATSTVWLIQMTGIPVFREGLNFTLPTGTWSVVEACSGVRYIIASVTVGTLYAYLTYRSWTRRLIFALVSAVVPIFANTVRAYIIVMLGHLSNGTIATGADHLIYGWVFFGIVIFVLFWLGAFFREDSLEQVLPSPVSQVQHTQSSASNGVLVRALITTLLLTSVSPLIAQIIGAHAPSAAQATLTLPHPPGEWRDNAVPRWRWSPPARVSGEQSAYFERDGEPLGLVVQYADGTDGGADVVGSSAFFALDDSDWRVVMQDQISVRGPDGEFIADEAQVRGSSAELLVWSWYRMGDVSTSNDYRAKVQQILARLGLAETGAYRITVAVPVQSSLADTQARLQDFIDTYAPLLYEELHRSSAMER